MLLACIRARNHHTLYMVFCHYVTQAHHSRTDRPTLHIWPLARQCTWHLAASCSFCESTSIFKTTQMPVTHSWTHPGRWTHPAGRRDRQAWSGFRGSCKTWNPCRMRKCSEGRCAASRSARPHVLLASQYVVCRSGYHVHAVAFCASSRLAPAFCRWQATRCAPWARKPRWGMPTPRYAPRGSRRHSWRKSKPLT